MIRFIFYLLLFYLLYRLLKSLFLSKKESSRFFRQETKSPEPPPYNPNNVEDIDYQEIKDRDSSQKQDE